MFKGSSESPGMLACILWVMHRCRLNAGFVGEAAFEVLVRKDQALRPSGLFKSGCRDPDPSHSGFPGSYYKLGSRQGGKEKRKVLKKSHEHKSR